MTGSSAWVFFYGSFMAPHVVATAGATLREPQPAKLAGFDILIAPLATMVRAERGTVWGVVARMPHAEIAALYELPWVGTYLPEAVIVETLDGALRPALTYIKHDVTLAPAADDYVHRIVTAAREHKLPEWYIERLDSFRPPGDMV